MPITGGKFKNRHDAGRGLAKKLRQYTGRINGVVIGIPRGGVPVASVVAKELGWPLGLILAKKIGHPVNKEYAIGLAGLDDYFVNPHNEDVSKDYITSEIEAIRIRLRAMQRQFPEYGKSPDLKGKTVIVVDDGVATGTTMINIIKLLRRKHPTKIIAAIPVGSTDAVSALEIVSDKVVTILIPDDFHAVSNFYEDFSQLSDEEVKSYLNA